MLERKAVERMIKITKYYRVQPLPISCGGSNARRCGQRFASNVRIGGDQLKSKHGGSLQRRKGAGGGDRPVSPIYIYISGVRPSY